MFSPDSTFKQLITDILYNGSKSGQLRPVYSDGSHAKTLYMTNTCLFYNLADGSFPITQLRPIPWKSAIKEMLTIYQTQEHTVEAFEKNGVNWWDKWAIDDEGNLGQRYGATVARYKIIDKLLKGLEDNPYNRRNIINLWQYADLEETDGLFPCAFQVMFDVRPDGDSFFLDCTLVQRSSDILVAMHINEIQYVALQMMIAKNFGWKVGSFSHYIQNCHIYDNQIDQANELLGRKIPSTKPYLKLNVPDETNFYDIKADDFELVDYDPVKPNLTFDLAI